MFGDSKPFAGAEGLPSSLLRADLIGRAWLTVHALLCNFRLQFFLSCRFALSLHRYVFDRFSIVPYRCGRLRGECFEPFASLRLAELPWSRARAESDPENRLEKASRTRRVLSFMWQGSERWTPEAPIRLYAKRASLRDARRLALAVFRPSKARKEWRIGLEMMRRGVPAPLPVVFAVERRRGIPVAGYHVSIELAGADAFDALFARLACDSERREALRRLGRFVRQGHEKGFFHDDCSAQHVFVETSGESVESWGGMHFIDVDNCGFCRATEWRIVKNAFQILRSFPGRGISSDEQTIFLEALFGRPLGECELERLRRRIRAWAEWKRRRKAVLKWIGLKSKSGPQPPPGREPGESPQSD
ncbi:MAG: 3-deoxy-D-manno-octulosonic-acid kinase [candidate division BRC1 bacterium ADurb.BinA364]|nr:MAG: 3-deoxy-D-manno-octulosonic-acid kinase [candidate division BRC1 bacterium ADurb.BinA364]